MNHASSGLVVAQFYEEFAAAMEEATDRITERDATVAETVHLRVRCRRDTTSCNTLLAEPTSPTRNVVARHIRQ